MSLKYVIIVDVSRITTYCTYAEMRSKKYLSTKLPVLTYCWSVLNSLPKTAKNEKVDSDAESSKQQDTANAFQALMEDSDEEDDIAVEEDMFPSTPVERPSLPSGSQPLSLDELMNSDERNDAVLFLLSLDEIMDAL